MPHTAPICPQIIPAISHSEARQLLATWAAEPENDLADLPVVHFEREPAGWNWTSADDECDFHGRIVGRRVIFDNCQ